MDWEAIWLSVRLAGATTCMLLVLGAPLAYWLSVRRSWLRVMVEALVASPLVLPPTVLGLLMLLLIRPEGAVGSAYRWMTGGSLAFSFGALLLASLVFSLPFAVQPMLAAFIAVDRRVVEASRCLGAGGARTFWRVVLPLSKQGVLGAAALTFAHTMGEFGVVLMVGGGIPGKTRTASVSIYDSVQSMEYGRAMGTAGVLIGAAVVALMVTTAMRRKPGREGGA